MKWHQQVQKCTHCFWRQGRKPGQWAVQPQRPDSSAACRYGRDTASVCLCPGESDPAASQIAESQQQLVYAQHTLCQKFTAISHRVPFVSPPTWASRTMKRLLGSLAWYWASCRSMAARRALFVPEKMRSLLTKNVMELTFEVSGEP